MTARSRMLVSLFAALPVLAALCLAAITSLRAHSEFAIACRVLSNRMVPVISSRGAGCALRPYDRVLGIGESGIGDDVRRSEAVRRSGFERGEGVLVTFSRNGVEGRIEVPVTWDPRGHVFGRFAAAALLSVLLVGTSLLVLWGSTSLAATPYLHFNACLSVFLISLLCGRHSESLQTFGLAAGGAIPATIAHLGMTFPRERGIARRVPQLIGMLYGANGVLILVSLVNFHRSPAVWALTDRALHVLALGTWSALVIQCIFAVYESSSVLERARAQVLLWGTLLVPALPLALGLSHGASVPGGALTLVAVGVAVLPLPVGYAIARYRLFDLGVTLRRAVAHVLYVAASAALLCAAGIGVSLALGTPPPFGATELLLSMAFLGLLITDPLRAKLWGAISGRMSPLIPQLQRLSDRHAQSMAELLDADACMRLLCKTVRDGLNPVGVAGFLAADCGWRLSHGLGRKVPVHPAAAGWASSLLGREEVIHLAEEEGERGPLRESLCSDGVELIAALRSGEETLGILLVSGSQERTPYTSYHLAFVTTALKQSAVAMLNAKLARDLMAAERFSTLGRVSAGLVHDLGKPLGVIERLAARLPEKCRDPSRLDADARTIASLASEMRATLRGFSADSRREEGADSTQGEVGIDAVVDRAIQIVSRSHGERPISVRLPPDPPSLSGTCETMVRVLVNLLDNAILASAPDEVIEVSVRAEGRDIAVDVRDRGCGMDPETASRVFEPFFSTRGPGEGSGLGLSICRDLVRGVNGTIRLDSAPGSGTRVQFRVPAALPGREGANTGG